MLPEWCFVERGLPTIARGELHFGRDRPQRDIWYPKGRADILLQVLHGTHRGDQRRPPHMSSPTTRISSPLSPKAHAQAKSYSTTPSVNSGSPNCLSVVLARADTGLRWADIPLRLSRTPEAQLMFRQSALPRYSLVKKRNAG